MDNTLTFLETLFPEVPKGFRIKMTHLGKRATERYAFSPKQVVSYVSPAMYKVNTYVGIIPTSSSNTLIPNWNVVWVDIDNYKHGADSLTKTNVPPSMVINSGRGVHMYWLLVEHISLHEIEDLNKRLIYNYNGDHQCWNRERILRLVGTTNRRHGEDDTYCDLISCEGHVYSYSEMIRQHPTPAKRLERRKNSNDEDYSCYEGTIDKLPDYWKNLMREGGHSPHAKRINWIWKGDGSIDRSKLIFSLLKTAKEYRVPPADIWALYQTQAPVAFEKLFDLKDDEAERYIYYVYSKIEVKNNAR